MTVVDGVLTTDRVDRVTAQARQWRFGRAVLSLLALVLVGVGRGTYAVLAGLWMTVTWTVAAVKVGWDDGRQAQAARRQPDA